MSNAALVSQIEEAIGAHGLWKMRLRGAIRSGTCDLTVQEASGDCNCKFGKWLHDPAFAPAHKGGVPHRVVTRVHAEFHREAGRVLQLALAGDQAAADAAMAGPFTETSEKLVRALLKWKGELLQPA
ncbi:MAG: CZB domain-containing protein [Novosphingobium sp.]